jgi:hypothetical protein
MLDLKKLFKIVKLSSSITLKDGTEVMVEGGAEAVGSKVFVELPNADAPVILPDGKYILEDDSEMIVKDGMIESISEAKTEDEVAVEEEIEAEIPVEAAVEVEVEPETTDEVPVEETPKPELEVKITELEDRLKAIEDMIASSQESQAMSSQKLQADFSALLEKLEKTDGVSKLAEKTPIVALTPAQLKQRQLKNAL